MTEMVVIKRTLPCDLTDGEWTDRSESLAKKEIERAKLEDEKRNVARGFTARINVLKDDINKLAAAVDSGEEEREVECFWQRADDGNEKLLIRRDTNTIIDRQSLGPTDRQMHLDDFIEGVGPEKEPDPQPDPEPGPEEEPDGEDDDRAQDRPTDRWPRAAVAE